MSVRLCLSALASLLLSTAAARADQPDVHPIGVEGQAAAAAPTVRGPLTVHFFKDGEPVGADYPVTYDGGHRLDFAATGLDSVGLSVRAHQSADVVPAFIEAVVEVL